MLKLHRSLIALSLCLFAAQPALASYIDAPYVLASANKALGNIDFCTEAQIYSL